MASKYILPCFRLKTGNRVKRVKDNECLAYRNELVEALDRAKGKLEGTWKALDPIVSKPEYQKYGEQLLDVLYTGGLLAPDGKLPTRGDLKLRTSYCVFKSHDELNALRIYEQLVMRLRRRHKHLDTVFEEHAQRYIRQLANFDMGARRRLGLLMALYLLDGQLNPRALLELGTNPANIDDGLAMEFMLLICGTLKRERGASFMLQVLKKSGLDHKIISFMPPMLRSDLYFRQVYQESDLNEVIEVHEERASLVLRKQLRQRLLDDFREKLPQLEIVMNVRQFQRERHMSDSEIIGIVWQTINETNASMKSRSSASPEQALRKLQIYAPLLNALCSTDSAQIALLMRLQEWCYEHHSLFKSFERLAVHLYRAGVLNEDAIVRWYEVDHIDKGKVAFLKQMHRFVRWLHSDTDASARVDYNSFMIHRQHVEPIYSDAVSTKLKFTKYN
ncbi:hypothetical protein AWZ03_013333 [Drosophila navojoa]|uniref:W2 domain-containing protein n=1 Tax=Drosophila navojoa TaxID=7232 RepID=A0A484AXG1_DRONA|nr:protein krasavietz-like [Drosophila navojoa]TDG40245.1 hypothetical protein AWZ03_013333 [Drosophila navojoa]